MTDNIVKKRLRDEEEFHTFSGWLKDSVERCGLSKNEVIRRCGMDRSTFYRILGGRRFPTFEQLNQLLDATCTADKIRKDIQDTYVHLALSDQDWQTYQAVGRILQVISGKEDAESDAEERRLPEAANGCLPAEGAASSAHRITGRKHVQEKLGKFIEEVFREKDPSIDFFLPYEYQEIIKTLRTGIGRMTADEANIRQLVQLRPGKDSGAQALEYFERILGLMLTARCRYSAYYIGDTENSESTGNLFPYYLISGDTVFFLSADMDTAVITKDPALVKTSRDVFSHLVKKAVPIRQSISYMEMLSQLEKPGKKISFQVIPCAALVARAEYIGKYMAAEFGELIWNHCHMLQDEEELMVYTSWSGIERFAENGIIEELPPGMMKPLDPEDRLQAVCDLREHAGRDFYIVDETRMAFSGKWLITVYENQIVYIYPRIASGTEEVISIREKNIVSAFTLFMHEFMKSGSVWSKKETRSRIDELAAHEKQADS